MQAPLVRLIRSMPGIDLVVRPGEDLPEYDLHCPMLSLPQALGTTVATIPGGTPYLFADEAQALAWRERLSAMGGGGKRVGLAWAGDAGGHSPGQAATDRRRSLAPGLLKPLLDLPGLQFFSLQKTGPAMPDPATIKDFMDEMTDFADAAALVANLDLVISVDTAVAHLTAALGKPVCLLDRFDPCWRWLDSPWCPGLRLYRQPVAAAWPAVLDEVVRDLDTRGNSTAPSTNDNS